MYDDHHLYVILGLQDEHRSFLLLYPVHMATYLFQSLIDVALYSPVLTRHYKIMHILNVKAVPIQYASK